MTGSTIYRPNCGGVIAVLLGITVDQACRIPLAVACLIKLSQGIFHRALEPQVFLLGGKNGFSITRHDAVQKQPDAVAGMPVDSVSIQYNTAGGGVCRPADDKIEESFRGVAGVGHFDAASPEAPPEEIGKIGQSGLGPLLHVEGTDLRHSPRNGIG